MEQTKMDIDKMLTPEEAAVWLKMSERDFLRKGRSGIIPVFKLGHSQVRAHPRTIIAKLAADAGVKREIIEASLGWRAVAPKAD